MASLYNYFSLTVISGSTIPEGNIAAPLGTMYILMAGGTAATVYQKIAQAVANVSDAIGWAQITPAVFNSQGGIFGTGIDGNLIFDGVNPVLGISPAAGVYAMTVDINAVNCTILAGVTVQLVRFRLFAQSLLINDGVVDASGTNGAALGAGIAGTAAGGTTIGGPTNTNRMLGGGGSGAGSSNTGTGTVGTNGGVMPYTTVVTGGTAGAFALTGQATNGGTPSGFYAGGGAGGSSGFANGNGGAGGVTQAIAPSYGKPQFSEILRGQLFPAAGANAFVFFGGGAGGGSSSQSGGGAGGGGGAGQLICMASAISGAGVFRAKGGNGGTGNQTVTAGGANGGAGGGGGGLVNVGFNSQSGTWGTDVTGGTGGAGGVNGANRGGNGGNGGPGRALVYPLSGS